MGLMAVAEGRGDWLMAPSGADLLRRALIDLMLEENGVAPGDRGGMLGRARLLTPEQHAELATIPPVGADRDSLLALHIHISGLFLPRARRLAAETPAAWPQALEAATRRHLRQRLGFELA
jgi:hypothetical protein